MLHIGIDIGSRYIKVAALSAGTPSVLVSCGLTQTPAQAVAKGRILDAAAVANELRLLLSELGLLSSRHRYAIAMDGQPMVLKSVSPWADVVAEEGYLLPYLAEQLLPGCSEDYELSCLRTTERGATASVLVGAVKACVRQRYDVLASIGLDSQGITASAAALANFGRWLLGDAGRALTAINVGAHHTELTLIRSGLPIAATTIELGGNDYEACLSAATQLSNRDIQRLRSAGGFETKLPGNVSMILQQFLTEFSEDIRRARQHLLAEVRALDIPLESTDLGLLHGGGALTYALKEHLANHLCIGVVDPSYDSIMMEYAQMDLDHESQFMLPTAIGAALSIL